MSTSCDLNVVNQEPHSRIDYPGKRPQTAWASKRRMYYDVDDDGNVDNDDDDDDDDVRACAVEIHMNISQEPF